MNLTLQLNFSGLDQVCRLVRLLKLLVDFGCENCDRECVALRENLRGSQVATSTSTDVICSSHHVFCWEADGPFK
jgi:hypothetical protein